MKRNNQLGNQECRKEMCANHRQFQTNLNVLWIYNPNGVVAQSPRLRGTRYLGKNDEKFNNLEEVVALNIEHGHNLFEVENNFVRLPRVVPLRETTLGFEAKPLRGFPIATEREKILFHSTKSEISNPLFSCLS
jgi:hypothetical protein